MAETPPEISPRIEVEIIKANWKSSFVPFPQLSFSGKGDYVMAHTAWLLLDFGN